MALITSELVLYVDSPNGMLAVSLKMMTATRTFPLSISTCSGATTLTMKFNR